MEWLEVEDVVGVLGIVVAIAGFAYERLSPGVKRIGYRVQMDAAIGSDGQNGQEYERLGWFRDGRTMQDTSLVLLRIENDGLRDIGRNNYESEDHGLTVTFADRTVSGVAVAEPNPPTLGPEFLTEAHGLAFEHNRIHIPKVALNKGQHFKLLVRLHGSGVGGKVTVDAHILEGRVRRNRNQARPSNRALGLGAFLMLLVSVQQFLLWTEPDPPSIACAEGELTVTGSTAFAPAMEEIGAAYENDCPGATVLVDAEGSNEGLQRLESAGRQRQKAPPMIALSDGRANGVPQLKSTPVGVTVFAVVVNDGTGVTELATSDLRKLYTGEIRNWSEVGGEDLPVRLVSRTSSSGTRGIFENNVLEDFEEGRSSHDCVRQDDASAEVLRCERSTTTQVLKTVGRTEGAIGYSEAQAARAAKGLTLLRLDDRSADAASVTSGRYAFRAVEYAYTYGRPPADSLASEFLGYMAGGAAQNILRTHGHLSCSGLRTPELC